MLNKEVNDWLRRVERKQYSYEDAMYEFMRFTSFLTRDEMKQIKHKLETFYKS